ncbi:MAG: bifunctional metallophosphatase/5'-nucleotidase [Chitinophagaceae bacterium]|nr:MAG: bifunctional metallophosphatase/5'-nucleotidase [Chitinophagaceae bacterium]
MFNRRKFIQNAGLATLAFGIGKFPFEALAEGALEKLVLLHTNDTHSRMEPFPEGSRFEGMGGISRRATLIKSIRSREKNVLLVDAGDIFQGTPYFNFYLGEPEIKSMSMMGYDLATLGNHDFDAGLDGLKRQLPNASFDFVSANYDFKDTILENEFKPYKVFQKGNIKIGILGLGIKLEGLVPPSLYGNTKYTDPVKAANKYSEILKNDYNCNYVIALSHLGFRYADPERISDHTIASQTENIDMIIGGHTHTFLDEPVLLKNKLGKDVIINQVGWGGIRLGRIDLYFDKKNMKIFSLKPNTVILDK